MIKWLRRLLGIRTAAESFEAGQNYARKELEKEYSRQTVKRLWNEATMGLYVDNENPFDRGIIEYLREHTDAE